MNNYFYENIRPLATLRRSNERFFDTFMEGYSNIYSAVLQVTQDDGYELSMALGYSLVSLAD